MTKQTIKVYLTREHINLLKQKADALGISERAWLSRYLEKLAITEYLFMDENLKKALKLFVIK